MEFINRLSTAVKIEEVVKELSRGITTPYDLGILFITPTNAFSAQDLVKELKSRISIKYILGCTCAGIISTDSEIERKPATSLILAQLPNVKILPFAIGQTQLEGLNTQKDWLEYFEVFPNENPVFLALPDPFSLDIHRFIQVINEAYPNCPMVGGLASAAAGPNENILILNNEFYTEGVVGVVLTGDIKVQTVVSQGCRPIGKTFIVTKADGNIIYELAGQPLLKVLQEVLDKSTARDKLLAQEAMFVGIAINEYKEHFQRGDFLIRGLMGIDNKTGAGAIADYIETGQTIQFHVRDAQTATEDLNELLMNQEKNGEKEKPKGALVFSCNGRGEYLFREKDHDIRIIQHHIGPVQAAGFFCAGEIGPISGNNFLHGFTDSIALFYPKN